MPRLTTFLFALAVTTSSGLLTAEPVNPFSRPTIAGPATGVGQQLSSDTLPELRGVIVAGTGSIANISGTVLSIGEEAAGYRLQSVTESSATFLHDDVELTLHLDDSAEEKD